MLRVPSFRDVGRSRNTSCYLSSLTNLRCNILFSLDVASSCILGIPSRHRHFGRAFLCAPPFCDYPGYGEHRPEGVALSGATTAIQTLRVASMKKLLNIVYWIGMAVSLKPISFGVCCHFTIDAIMRILFVFIPVCAGLTIGLCCVEYLLRQRR